MKKNIIFVLIGICILGQFGFTLWLKKDLNKKVFDNYWRTRFLKIDVGANESNCEKLAEEHFYTREKLNALYEKFDLEFKKVEQKPEYYIAVPKETKE